jgi:hypothetical protein
MSKPVENDSLIIKEIAPSRYGILTKVFGVYLKPTGDLLGTVLYEGYAKQYIFKPRVESALKVETLDFISTFIKSLTEAPKV